MALLISFKAKSIFPKFLYVQPLLCQKIEFVGSNSILFEKYSIAYLYLPNLSINKPRP